MFLFHDLKKGHSCLSLVAVLQTELCGTDKRHFVKSGMSGVVFVSDAVQLKKNVRNKFDRNVKLFRDLEVSTASLPHEI